MAGTLAAGVPAPMYAATWQENADYIFSILTQKMGYTEAAACGIMANIRCESTFNPHAWNAGGGSYGLCQWTGGRYGRLRSWCGSNGYDYTTIDGQLAYLEYELQNHYPGVEKYIRSVENTSSGAYDAGQYYCYHFEAPASRGSVSVYRGGLASGTFWSSYRPAEWYLVDGIWHYILRDGSYQTSWLTLEDKTYYFDEDGKRIVGWKTIDGNRYYFDNDGVMTTGWQKIDGRSYYFGNNGSLVTGLVHNGDEWFLLDEAGVVQASSAMESFAPVWIASAKEEESNVQKIDSGDAVQLADAETESISSSDTKIKESSGIGSLEEEKKEVTALADAGFAAPSLNEDRNVPVLSPAASAKQDAKESTSSINVLEKASEKASTLLADAIKSSQDASSSDSPESEQNVLLAKDAVGDIAEDDEDPSNDPGLAARAMQDAANALNEEPEEEESIAAAWMKELPLTFSDISSPESITALPAAGIRFDSDDLMAAADLLSDKKETASGNSAANPEDEKDKEREKDKPDGSIADSETKNPDEVSSNSESEKPDIDTVDSGSEKPDKDTVDPESEKPDEDSVDPDSEKPDEDTVDSESEKPDEDTVDSDSEKPDEDSVDPDSEKPDEDTVDSESEKPDEDTADSVSENPEDDRKDTLKTKTDAADTGNTSYETVKEDTQDKIAGKEDDENEGSTAEIAEEEEEKEEDTDTSEMPFQIPEEDPGRNNQLSLSDLEKEIQSTDQDAEGTDVHQKENKTILISLVGNIPDIHRDEMDSLVDILREKKILRAVTSSGLDITPDVTADFTPSDTDDGKYIVTFHVEFGEDSAETTSYVFVIDD